MRKILLKNTAGLAVLALLLATAAPAGADVAKPSPAEINKARGECGVQKQKFRALEARTDPDSPKLAAARLEWEHACGHAQALIDAAAGRTPPPIVAPRPTIELPPVPPAAAAPASPSAPQPAPAVPPAITEPTPAPPSQ